MPEEFDPACQKSKEILSKSSRLLGLLPTNSRLRLVQKYVLTLLFVAGATLLSWLLEQSFGDRYRYILFGPPVILAALIGGVGPGLLATALSALAATLTFPAPHGLLSVVVNPQDGFAMVLFFAHGIFVTLVLERVRRARAEEIRREDEEHLRSLYESSLDGILLTIAETGEIVGANPAALSMFNMTMEEIRQAGRTGVIAQDAELTKRWEERSKHGKWRGELTLRRKDGSTFPADLSSSFFTGPNGTIMSSMSIRDISERKSMEEKLRKSQAEEITRLATAVESADESILITDPSFVIQYVNPSFSRLTGYSRDDAIDRDVKFLRSGQTDPADYERQRAKARDEGGYRVQRHIRTKDGRTLTVETTVSHVRGAGNAITNFVMVWRDITGRLHLEEQLRQAQKMEAIGTLAGGIAHDFNNVLAIIVGNAELALDDIATSSDGPRENIEQIVNASKRATDLVKEILAFSRKSEDRGRNAFRLIPLVEETYKLLRGTLPSTIRMELDLQTESDTILGVPSQIQQVIMNLASNATYEMRERGGVLTIGVSQAKLTEGSHTLDTEIAPGTYVKLTVRDTGKGMADEVRKRIFEPFFTTKEAGQGTGMGLAVVYGIVKNHDGALSVESAPGEGTTFNIFLPHIDATIKEDRPRAGDVPGGKERILFVDDEADLAEIGSRMLRRLGYEVTAAANASAALKVFLDVPDRFDLVITDQTMPDLTGMDLAQRMLEVRKDLPIILVTGYSETVSPERAKSVGIREFVLKPIARQKMAETVRRILDARNETFPGFTR